MYAVSPCTHASTRLLRRAFLPRGPGTLFCRQRHCRIAKCTVLLVCRKCPTPAAQHRTTKNPFPMPWQCLICHKKCASCLLIRAQRHYQVALYRCPNLPMLQNLAVTYSMVPQFLLHTIPSEAGCPKTTSVLMLYPLCGTMMPMDI